MTQENAAQVEGTLPGQEQEQEQLKPQEGTEAQKAESAPADATTKTDEEVVQQRINKEVSRRHVEKRRADEAERKLAEMQKNQPAVQVGDAPTLESCDFDEAKFNRATIDHQVAESIQTQTKELQKNADAQTNQKAQDNFEERIEKMGKADFDEVSNKLPLLPKGVAEALVRSENGAELIYHLGTHLDLADKVANMSPSDAMMELGKISAGMPATKETQTSAAPDPIVPLSSGGSISQERGPKGATYE